MDGKSPSISPHELYPRLGTAAAPVVIDVRREDVLAADDWLIVGTLRCPHDQVRQWAKDLPANRVVAYCSDGREVSQGAA